MLLGLVDVAFPQPFSDWLESLIIEPEAAQQRGKPLKEHFLEKARAFASALLVIGASRLLLVFLFVMGNLHWVRLFEPSRADAVDQKHGLGEIDPDRANLHVDAPLM